GIVSPVGNDVSSSWRNIVAGVSGVAPIETFDVTAYATRFGAGIKDFDVTPYMEVKEARKMDLFMQYGMVAAIQALRDSGLEIDDSNAHRIGAAIGSGIGGL